MTPKCQGRDPIIFEAVTKLFNFYHKPTLVTDLIYTDVTVSYRDALDRLHVRLNIILLPLTKPPPKKTKFGILSPRFCSMKKNF